MEIGYFKRSWKALTQDKSWWKVMLVYSLVQLIPVIGSMAVQGYLFRWAREAAWGIEKPLPNKMGDVSPVLKTGAIVFVASLIWSTVMSFANTVLAQIPFIGVVFAIVGLLALLVLYMVLLIMMMRATIYDSIEPVIQVRQAWDMARRDTNGLLKIFGMYAAVLGVIFAATIILCAFIALICLLFIPAVESIQSNEALMAFVLSVLPVAIIVFSVFVFAITLVSTTGMALVIRAMGYWTAQFEPAKWGPSKELVPANLGPNPQQAA